MGFAAPLLLAALATSATLEYGARSELRGVGRPAPGEQAGALSLAFEPSLGLRLEPTHALNLGIGYVPGLLVLSDAAGGASVGTTTLSHRGQAVARWQAEARLLLTLSGAASISTLQTSPLARLGATAEPPPGSPEPPPTGPAPPAAPSVDPLSRGGTGRYESEELHLAVEWAARRDLRLGATAGVTRSGGVGTPGRELFPPRLLTAAGASATWAISALDDLGLLAGYDDNRLTGPGQGTVTALRLESRWDHRLSPTSGTWLSAGVNDTLRDSTGVPLDSPFGAYAPQLECGVTAAAAAAPGRSGHRATLRLSYAPYLDPFANERTQRVAAQGALEWRPREELGLLATLLAAQAVGADGLGPFGLAGELGAGLRLGGWELGTGLRGGLQRTRGPPVIINRSWGFFALIAWRGERRL